MTLLVIAVDRYFVVCRNELRVRRLFPLTSKVGGEQTKICASVVAWTICVCFLALRDCCCAHLDGCNCARASIRVEHDG